MYTRPADVRDDDLAALLRAAWDFDAARLEYRAVGFGSHHWAATATNGERRFVTIDDLMQKRRTDAANVDDAFARLARTFTAVRALSDATAADWIVAPIPARDGSVLRRIGGSFSVVLHPYVDGRAVAPWGAYEDPADLAAVLDRLVELHAATRANGFGANREDGVIPHRDTLIAALGDLDRPWDAGPYGERARSLLESHADGVRCLLAAYDELMADVLRAPARMVLTHGEPHAGNVMVSGGRHYLIDWDSAMVGPPERDLWDLDPGDGSLLRAYESATGTAPVADVIACYQQWYDLAEIAVYITLFRQPHDECEDSAESWNNLLDYLNPRERWPALFG